MEILPTFFLLVPFFQTVLSTLPDQRILNGLPVTAQDVPYHAFVQPWYRDPISKRPESFVCGGSLISTRHVLTAAHCVLYSECKEAVMVVVRLGSNIRDQGDRFYAKWIIHEDYYKECDKSHIADIALLLLKRNVKLSDTIWPVRLPFTQSINQLEGARALVSGYGVTEYGRVSHFLRATNVSIASKSFCHFHEVAEDHICAKIHNHQTDCRGDSGGPVVLNNVLYGIVSYGPTDCSTGTFSAYTSVIYYMDWIVENLK